MGHGALAWGGPAAVAGGGGRFMIVGRPLQILVSECGQSAMWRQDRQGGAGEGDGGSGRGGGDGWGLGDGGAGQSTYGVGRSRRRRVSTDNTVSTTARPTRMNPVARWRSGTIPR